MTDAADRPRRNWLRLRRLAVAVVLLAALVWIGRWCYVRATTRPPGAEPYELLMARLLPKVPNDVLPEMLEAVSLLPAEPYVGFDPLVATRGEWDPANRPVLRDAVRYLDLAETRRTLDAMRRLTGRRSAYDAQSAIYRPLRQVVKTLAAKARLRLERDQDASGAADDLLLALDQARMLYEQPVLISQLVAMGIDQVVCEDVRHLARDPRTPAPVLEKLAANMDAMKLPHRLALGDALGIEQQCLVAALDELYTRDGDGDGWLDVESLANRQLQAGFGIGVPADARSAWGGLWNVLSPSFRSREECARTIRAHFDAVAEADQLSGTAAMDRIEETARRADRYSVIDGPVRYWCYGIHRAAQLAVQSMMARHATRTIIAIELYRRAHGSLPADLNSLAAFSLAEPPLDWYADASFRYHVDGGAYKLYSVSQNRVDDSGTPSRYERWDDEGDYVFTVARRPANDRYYERERQNAYWPEDETDDSDEDGPTTTTADPNAP